MNLITDLVARSFLQKESLEQCSIHDVQKLVDQHPYFGAAHLLLAIKMQPGNEDLYQKQLQKTSLYFNNPLWLDHLLNETGGAELIPAATFAEEEETSPIIADEIIMEPINQPEELKEENSYDETEFVSDTFVESENQNQETIVELPPFKMPPVETAGTELIFEPYHTVDYFASQGIKFKEEMLQQDKFGKQLKSFTEWLKTLKRLPESAVALNVETSAEQKVEELAGQSIQDREVVTEAMADVWEKQGNHEKAIEIYNKLSLLDASKSRYFAAKIEELKKTN
ncbi:MAG: hypothetical protein ABUT20_04740 [Bacteroidota bacterium]